MARHTLGVIIGNRDFFPDVLVSEARKDVLALCESLGVDCVLLGRAGDEARRRRDVGRTQRPAPTCFAPTAERSTACWSACRTSATKRAWPTRSSSPELNVPVLVQAYPDDLEQLHVERRRDAFCGKVSVCNNLSQYGIPFSLTERHTLQPSRRRSSGRTC